MFAFTFNRAIYKPHKGFYTFDSIHIGTTFYIKGHKYVKRSVRTAFAYIYDRKKASRRCIKLSQQVQVV